MQEIENLKQANQGLQDNLAETTGKYNLLKEQIMRIARSLGFNITPAPGVTMGQIISGISAYIAHLMNLKSRIYNLGAQYGVYINPGEARIAYERRAIAAIEAATFQENSASIAESASPQASEVSFAPLLSQVPIAAPFAYHPLPPAAAAHSQQADQHPALLSSATFSFPPHNGQGSDSNNPH